MVVVVVVRVLQGRYGVAHWIEGNQIVQKVEHLQNSVHLKV